MLLLQLPKIQVCLTLAQVFYTFLKLNFPALKSTKMKTERTVVFLFLCWLTKGSIEISCEFHLFSQLCMFGLVPFIITVSFLSLWQQNNLLLLFSPSTVYLYSAFIMGGSVVLICCWRMFSSYKQTKPLLELLKNAGLKLFVLLLPVDNYSCENSPWRNLKSPSSKDSFRFWLTRR